MARRPSGRMGPRRASCRARRTTCWTPRGRRRERWRSSARARLGRRCLLRRRRGSRVPTRPFGGQRPVHCPRSSARPSRERVCSSVGRGGRARRPRRRPRRAWAAPSRPCCRRPGGSSSAARPRNSAVSSASGAATAGTRRQSSSDALARAPRDRRARRAGAECAAFPGLACCPFRPCTLKQDSSGGSAPGPVVGRGPHGRKSRPACRGAEPRRPRPALIRRNRRRSCCGGGLDRLPLARGPQKLARCTCFAPVPDMLAS
mmetsp:Transcript_103120/g.280213  ORF Transcript_103120/g.280213 Transcript_103120/m.280213 type:complete len:260 (+) Transcript_103120:599-1378(+)